MIFLQGWGEPLTHPHFWQMVALAKQTGAQVGFLTNGLLFDRQAIDTACTLNVDLIAFTFAGATAKTHERCRNGSSFSQLTQTIQLLSDIKANNNQQTPVISISYTLMRENIAEFPAAVALANDLGATQIIASHLDCIPSRDLEPEAIFLRPQPEDIRLIAAAEAEAQKRGMSFKAEPPHLSGEILVCEPNPLHVTLYVRVNGTVVPCHQMALEPDIIEHLYFHGQAVDYQPVTLGNLTTQSLPDIVAGKPARHIYQVFDDRANCIVAENHQLPEVPPLCQKCYKLYGV